MVEEAVLRSLICWAYRMGSSPAFGVRSSYLRMAQALNFEPHGGAVLGRDLVGGVVRGKVWVVRLRHLEKS